MRKRRFRIATSTSSIYTINTLHNNFPEKGNNIFWERQWRPVRN